MYYNVHENWWSSIFWRTLQKRWFIFVKRELEEKIAGFDCIFESVQTWRAWGHSKNTWCIDSYDAPHLAQHIFLCIPLAFRLFLTAIHPDTSCHKKCLIFGGHLTFEHNTFKISIVGPNKHCCLFFYLVGRFNRVFPIIGNMPAIPISHSSYAQKYAFYYFCIMGFH